MQRELPRRLDRSVSHSMHGTPLDGLPHPTALSVVVCTQPKGPGPIFSRSDAARGNRKLCVREKGTGRSLRPHKCAPGPNRLRIAAETFEGRHELKHKEQRPAKFPNGASVCQCSCTQHLWRRTVQDNK